MKKTAIIETAMMTVVVMVMTVVVMVMTVVARDSSWVEYVLELELDRVCENGFSIQLLGLY